MTTECVDCPDDEATLPTAGPDPRGTKVIRWGPQLLAPIGVPTGDGRRFATKALTARDCPMPLKWQRSDGQGHSGSVTVGTIDGITFDKDGAPHGFGLFFDPDPEQLPRLAEDCAEARQLWASGAVGPSVDLDSMVFQADAPDGVQPPADGSEYAAGRQPILVTGGRISAATLVPIPAFAEAGGKGVFAELDPEEYQREVDSYRARVEELGQTAVVAAVTSGWASLPVADAGTGWDAGAAVKRLRAWAAGDPDKLSKAFAWVEPGQDGAAPDLKFPVADVVDGGLKLVPRAVSAALAVLDGARGGTTLDEEDQGAMRTALERARKRWDPDDDGDDDRSAQTDTDHDTGKAVARMRKAMVAAASMEDPAAPPAEWFADPRLTGPTAIKVTPDGRVFGHLATWGTCHMGSSGTCITPPRSRTNYAYFHTGAVLTADGQEVPVGRVSIGGGHADTRLGFRAAAEHYDSTSAQAATVRAGEDKFGIWIAGALVPGADAAAVRRSPFSGDWRRIGGNMELMHALAVNSGGFPVPRGAMTASGHQLSLVAAGMVVEDYGGADLFAPEPDQPDVNELVRTAVDQYRAEEAAFARRAKATALLERLDQDIDKMGEAGERLVDTERARRRTNALRRLRNTGAKA